MNERALLLVVFLSACGGEMKEPIELTVAPEDICDPHLAASDAWCGGSPEGQWTFLAACHRPVLEWLTSTCPEGSFEMHPGIVRGKMTLTSTSIEANFIHDAEMDVRVDLHQACIETIGVCPRSHDRTLLHWDVESDNECSGHIEIAGSVGHDGGGVHVDGNRIAYDFNDAYSGEFCAADDYLYLNALLDDAYAEKAYYYILERNF